MESTSLDSVLSGQAPEVAEPAQTQQAETQAAQVQDSGTEATGDKTAPPAEPQKDDHIDRARKGLEAAATAERQRRQAAEARAEAAERRAQALEQQHKQAQQPTQPDPNEPKREDYASDTDYIRALARHEAKAMREAEKADEARARQEAETRSMLDKTEPIYAKAQALPGFNRDAFDHFLTPTIAHAVFDSDDSVKLMHHLGANLDEMQRIAQLSPGKQARELSRIEDKLAEQQGDADEDKPEKPPQLPSTLTQTRNAKGRFEPAYAGPTPLNAILASK